VSIMNRLDLVAQDLEVKAQQSIDAGEQPEDIVEAIYEELWNYTGRGPETSDWVREQSQAIFKSAQKDAKDD